MGINNWNVYDVIVTAKIIMAMLLINHHYVLFRSDAKRVLKKNGPLFILIIAAVEPPLRQEEARAVSEITSGVISVGVNEEERVKK